jgi:hypothetical protein
MTLQIFQKLLLAAGFISFAANAAMADGGRGCGARLSPPERAQIAGVFGKIDVCADEIALKLESAFGCAGYHVVLGDPAQDGRWETIGTLTTNHKGKGRLTIGCDHRTPLPFGKARVAELGGFRLEVRDFAGAVVLQGTVPAPAIHSNGVAMQGPPVVAGTAARGSLACQENPVQCPKSPVCVLPGKTPQCPSDRPAPAASTVEAVKTNVKEASAAKLTIDDLPAPTKATLQRELAGGRIVELLKKTKKGQALFHADVVIDRKEGEIEVALDGTLLRKEID